MKERRVRRIRDRLPRAAPPTLGLSPTIALKGSRASEERDALRRLTVQLSRRRVLWEGVELEFEDAALASTVSILDDTEQARLALPRGSAFDLVLEHLQDVCNRFRTDVESRPRYPFGEALFELRVGVMAFAGIARDEFDLAEAERLFSKVNPSTARSPMGPTLGVIKDGVFTPIEQVDDVTPALAASRARLLGPPTGS
jgi:hypothetical protein